MSMEEIYQQYAKVVYGFLLNARLIYSGRTDTGDLLPGDPMH